MSNRKTKIRTLPKLPNMAEIDMARKIVTETRNPWDDLDKDPTPEVMASWRGTGWHTAEVYFGILIGLQIAKTREEKRESCTSLENTTAKSS